MECGQLTKIMLPGIEDMEEDYESTRVQLANATTFVTFVEEENAFTIQAGATSASDVGLYAISVTLTDQE